MAEDLIIKPEETRRKLIFESKLAKSARAEEAIAILDNKISSPPSHLGKHLGFSFLVNKGVFTASLTGLGVRATTVLDCREAKEKPTEIVIC
jgi:hypothetical protein